MQQLSRWLKVLMAKDCRFVQQALDRDENAAINILMKALEILGENPVGHTEINAHGQLDLCLVGETLSGKLTGKTRQGKK